MWVRKCVSDLRAALRAVRRTFLLWELNKIDWGKVLKNSWNGWKWHYCHVIVTQVHLQCSFFSVALVHLPHQKCRHHYTQCSSEIRGAFPHPWYPFLFHLLCTLLYFLRFTAIDIYYCDDALLTWISHLIQTVCTLSIRAVDLWCSWILSSTALVFLIRLLQRFFTYVWKREAGYTSLQVKSNMKNINAYFGVTGARHSTANCTQACAIHIYTQWPLY